MRTLDLNTIGIIGLTLHASLALVMVLTYFTRRTYPGFRSWTIGLVSWVLMCVALYFRPELGDAVALGLGTLTFYLFALLIHNGMVRFYGLENGRARLTQDIIAAALGLGVVAVNYVYFRVGDVRVFANSLVGAFILGRAAFDPLRVPGARRSFIQVSLSLALGSMAALLAVRAVTAMVGVDYAAAQPTDPLYKLALVFGLFLDVVLVYGFISLVHVRLEGDLLDAQVRLQTLADTDALTGLYNRRGFRAAATRAISLVRRYGHTASLIIFDLDHFKKINDTYGHGTGDVVLAAVASALRKVTRDSDVLARWGGEEFAVLMPETDLEGALLCAERMRREMHDLRPSDNPDIWTSASFGVARLGADGLDELTDRADTQLYRAKREGRDRVCAES